MLVEKPFNPSKGHSEKSAILHAQWERMLQKEKDKWQSFSKYREAMEVQQQYEIRE